MANVTEKRATRSTARNPDLSSNMADTQNESTVTDADGVVTLDVIWQKLVSIELNQKELRTTLTQSITQLKQEILSDINKRLNSLKNDVKKDCDALSNECASLKNDITVLKDRINAIDHANDPYSDIDKCVVVVNFPAELHTNLQANVIDMLEQIDVDNAHDIVIGCKRLGNPEQQTRDKPGLVKIAVDCLDSKKLILRAKRKLKNTVHLKKTWIRSSMTHVERVMQMNMKTLLKCVPENNRFRVNAYGKIVPNTGTAETNDADVQDSEDEMEGFQTHRGRRRGNRSGPNRGGTMNVPQPGGRGGNGRGRGRGRGGTA